MTISTKVNECVKAIADEQGDSFVMVFGDLLHSNELSIDVWSDLGVEELQDSYIPHMDQSYIDWLSRQTEQVFEVIINTDDGVFALYFVGRDDDSMVMDIQRRYAELKKADL